MRPGRPRKIGARYPGGKAMMEGLEKLDLTFQQTPSQYASWNERVLLGMPVRSKLRRRPAP